MSSKKKKEMKRMKMVIFALAKPGVGKPRAEPPETADQPQFRVLFGRKESIRNLRAKSHGSLEIFEVRRIPATKGEVIEQISRQMNVPVLKVDLVRGRAIKKGSILETIAENTYKFGLDGFVSNTLPPPLPKVPGGETKDTSKKYYVLKGIKDAGNT